jgi:hypothetical protein
LRSSMPDIGGILVHTRNRVLCELGQLFTEEFVSALESVKAIPGSRKTYNCMILLN